MSQLRAFFVWLTFGSSMPLMTPATEIRLRLRALRYKKVP